MNSRTFREKSLYAPLKDKTMFPNPKIKNSLRIEELSHLQALLPSEGNTYNEKTPKVPKQNYFKRASDTSTRTTDHHHLTISIPI